MPKTQAIRATKGAERTLEDFRHRLCDATALKEVKSALSGVVQEAVGASGVVFFPLHWGITPDSKVVLHAEYVDPGEAEVLAITGLPLMNQELGFLSSYQKEGTRTRNVVEYYGRRLLERTWAYNEIIRPCKIDHMLSAFMSTEQIADLGYLLITRSPKERPFTDRDLGLTESIRSATEQALSRIAQTDGGCVAPMEILTVLASSVPQSCAILDQTGRLVWANRAAERQLGENVMSLSGKYLICSKNPLLEKWQRAIRQFSPSTNPNSAVSPEVIINRIERTSHNPLYLIIDPAAKNKRPLCMWALSAREKEIAELAAQGYSPLNIGAMLSITVGTVRVHLKSIYRKLRVSSRVELALRMN